MQNRNVYKKDLDAIGQKLVESTRLSGVDVDQIVANPHLYDLVRARVVANVETQVPTAVRGYTFNQRFATAAAVMAILLVTSVAMIRISNSENSWSAVVVEQVPGVIPVAARSDHPPKPMFRKLPSGRAVYSQTRAKASIPIKKRSEQTLRSIPTSEHAGEFYALSYTGNTEETVAGGRIIRVDLPRSSLFAMGINIPLENDREVIKTDLLIGSDGMTRAVRVVE